MTFQMIYSMLLYLKNSGSNQRKTKTVLIDCCLSLMGNDGTCRWHKEALLMCES